MWHGPGAHLGGAPGPELTYRLPLPDQASSGSPAAAWQPIQ